MKIAIACDHGALDLKNAVVAHLQKRGFEGQIIDDFHFKRHFENAARQSADARNVVAIEILH